ncbi:transposase [Tepidibacillus decaturensis]|uniref:Transposase n=2 Tax=Tepidibacillus decaturensis TaxID=1413211 RepID=A0A135L7K4_9BACI|nr:transposase [Tepidibacillus decaturensis]
MYLTSWNEDIGLGEVRSTWKGYPFDTINELTDEGLIYGSHRSKSVSFTDEGIKAAEELVRKYLSKPVC